MGLSHVRLGVIGLGSMGRRHLETLARLQLGRLAAVATRSADKRAEASAEFGVTAVEDYRQLEDLVDAVVVCVPTVLPLRSRLSFLSVACTCWWRSPSRQPPKKPWS